MSLYFVGAGPGDPDLLTIKALKILEKTDCCIWAGSLVNPNILNVLPKHAEIHDSAVMALPEIMETMIAAHNNGKCVVRLHTGDPCLYSAIGEQMDHLTRHNIPYQVVPGVSAFQGAAAALQMEMTRPELVQTVVLTRTPGRTPMPETEDLTHFAQTRATLCIYLSTGRLAEVAKQLIPYYGENCPAAVVYKATWPEERIIRGVLTDIAEKTKAAGISRTALIVVGWAIQNSGTRSALYASSFSHGFRKANSE